MKRFLIVGSIFVIIAVSTALLFGNRFYSPISSQTVTLTPAPFVPYSASFGVFTNGTVRVFSSSMYFNKSPDVYIQNKNPNIVFVRRPEITWQNFFDTLPMKLTPSCLTTGTNETFCTNEQTALRFFLNGTEDPQVLSKVIKSNDRLLISYGLITEDEVKRQYQSIPSVELE